MEHTESEINMLITRLKDLHIAGLPTTKEELHFVERTFGCTLPDDLGRFYLRSNGTVEATPVEHGWVRFWPFKEWRRVEGLALSGLYANVRKAIVFADHCDASWWYAVDVCGDQSKSGIIYIVDGLRPARQVAESFCEFLQDVLEDQPSIYPVDA